MLSLLFRGLDYLLFSAYILLITLQAFQEVQATVEVSSQRVAFSIAFCLILFLILFPISFAVVVVYELIRILVAWRMGLRFAGFKFGPLLVERRRGLLRWRWLNIQPWCHTDFTPRPDAPSLSHWVLFLLSAPLVCIVTGYVLLSVAAIVNPGPGDAKISKAFGVLGNLSLLCPGDLATASLNVLGFTSLKVGLAALIPRSTHQNLGVGIDLERAWRLRASAWASDYPRRAAYLVWATVLELSQQKRQDEGGGLAGSAYHVRARDVCDYLLDGRGGSLMRLLRECRLLSSEDVGRVMFILVEQGVLARDESDSKEDFQGLFELGET